MESGVIESPILKIDATSYLPAIKKVNSRPNPESTKLLAIPVKTPTPVSPVRMNPLLLVTSKDLDLLDVGIFLLLGFVELTEILKVIAPVAPTFLFLLFLTRIRIIRKLTGGPHHSGHEGKRDQLPKRVFHKVLCVAGVDQQWR